MKLRLDAFNIRLFEVISLRVKIYFSQNYKMPRGAKTMSYITLEMLKIFKNQLYEECSRCMRKPGFDERWCNLCSIRHAYFTVSRLIETVEKHNGEQARSRAVNKHT